MNEQTGNPEEKKTGTEKLPLRDRLALGIIIIAGGGVVILAVIMIYSATSDTARKDAAQLVMTGVLPLLGVWVGTILAYYFSKENLQAATESFTKVAALRQPEEKLKAIPVKTVMIKKDAMEFETLPADQLKLVATRNKIQTAGKGERRPILDDQKQKVVYMVHKSAIDSFLTTMATSPPPAPTATPPKLEDLTLKDMLDKGGDLKALLEGSFAFVEETATLDKAKATMENTKNCQDVFVTAGGTKDEAVLGWITNEIIQKNAKL